MSKQRVIARAAIAALLSSYPSGAFAADNHWTGAAGNTNWIEFQNTTDSQIDIGGWFLSDDNASRQKFTLPAAFVIAPHAFASIAHHNSRGT